MSISQSFNYYFHKLFLNTNCEKAVIEAIKAKKLNDYNEKKKRLNTLLQNEMKKPSIAMEEIQMPIDTWEEYTIEHIYADMQVLKKAFVKMRTLPNVKDIALNSDTLTYDFTLERGDASIIVDCYKIKLTAWNLGEEESLKILDFCVDEIVEVQENNNQPKSSHP